MKAVFEYMSASTGQISRGELQLEDYARASTRGMRVSQYINQKYADADPKFGSAYEQAERSLGIFRKGDPKMGIVASSIKDVLNGECMEMMPLYGMQTGSSPSGGGTIVSPGGPNDGSSSPASRLFFPETVMALAEEHLVSDYSREIQIFNSMLASDETIGTEVFIEPVIDTTKPRDVRPQAIGQNTLPRNMVSITASQTAKRITTTSVGLQISDQALDHTTLDLVGIIVAQQLEGEREAKLWEDLAAIVAGNKDSEQTALTPVAGTDFDAGMTGGAITQKGWLKMLNDPSRKIRVNALIGTLDDAVAIQERVGRPLMFDPNTAGANTGNLGTYGMNVEMQVLNFENYAPAMMIVPDGLWAAQHLLTLDTRYAMRRVTNTSASYSAVEQAVLQRSNFFRFDTGSQVHRLRDEAFQLVDYS